MAASARAAQALLFMQHCRRPPRPKAITSIRQASDAMPSSQYSPSNFARQLPARNNQNNNSSASSHYPSSLRSQLNAHTLPGPRPTYAHPLTSPPPPQDFPRVKLNPWIWFKMQFGWRPKPSYKPAPIHIANNPWRARKKWPPDFRSLDPKQRFHFEKTYRRRAALKWARPTWNKSIKILQQTLITFTLVYFIFILEPTHGQGTPFDGFRVWFFGKMRNLAGLPEATREEADKLSEEALQRMKKSTEAGVETSPANV